MTTFRTCMLDSLTASLAAGAPMCRALVRTTQYASWQSGHSITLPTNSAALQHIRTHRYHGLYGAPRAVHQARPRAMPVRRRVVSYSAVFLL